MQETINKILMRLISAGGAKVSSKKKKVQKNKINKIKGDKKLTKKKSGFLLFITALLFIIGTSFSDSWQWINPQPQGNNLSSVSFINPAAGIAVGQFGTILKTTSGGVSWVRIDLNTRKQFYKAIYVNPNVAYISGDSGMVYKSVNSDTNRTVENNY